MELIKDTGWTLDKVRSRPIKGWYVYERTIELNEPLNKEGVLEFKSTLKNMGHTPVELLHQDGTRLVFQCCVDSGD